MPRSNSRSRTGDPDLDLLVQELITRMGVVDDVDLVTQMIASVVKMGRDGHERGDLKIANQALRELRNSYRSFAPYRDQRKASIFGSARTPEDSPAYAAAREMGRVLAERDWMIITGGGPGIMTAGVEGAGRDNSFGVTIRLPFESMEGGGIVPDERMVRFRYFFTRKLTFMKESSAYVCFPGGFGTLDETFELLTLLQTGKESPSPVVLFDPPGETYWQTWRQFVLDELVPENLVSPADLNLVHLTSSVDDAADYICDFYRRYHSMRYVEGHLVLRLLEPISDGELEALNNEFADIVANGRIERVDTSQVELDDHDAVDLPRLALNFDNRHFARLHQLVRALSSGVAGS